MIFVTFSKGNALEDSYEIKEIHQEEVGRVMTKLTIGRAPEVCPEFHIRDHKGICRFKFRS